MRKQRKSFLQQYNESLQNREAYKVALGEAIKKEKVLAKEFCDTFSENSGYEEIHEEIKKQWKVIRKLERACDFWDCVVKASIYFATKEEAVKVLSELLSDPKMAKAKAHHKKVESFMLEKYPHLTMYESSGVLYIRLKGQNYEEQRHGEVCILLDEVATAFMNNDNIKKFVKDTEIPQANAKELVKEFLAIRKQWEQAIRTAREQTQNIKSRLGYSTTIFMGRHTGYNKVESFYF